MKKRLMVGIIACMMTLAPVASFADEVEVGCVSLIENVGASIVGVVDQIEEEEYGLGYDAGYEIGLGGRIHDYEPEIFDGKSAKWLKGYDAGYEKGLATWEDNYVDPNEAAEWVCEEEPDDLDGREGYCPVEYYECPNCGEMTFDGLGCDNCDYIPE